MPVDFHVNSASSKRQTAGVTPLRTRPSKLKMCVPVRFWANGEPHQSLTDLRFFFSQNEPRVSMVSVCVPAPVPRKMEPESSSRPPGGALIVTSFAWKLTYP